MPIACHNRLRPRDLLDIIGDAGAVLISSEVAEVQSLSRRVDSALRLRRGRERYVRHLEFEMKYRKGLELRCFEYAALLAVHFRLPILTTVVLVEKSGPRELAYREILGGRVVHERRFDVVRLWEMDPEKALRFGPGAAALVGPAEQTTLPLVGRAARKIQRETKGAVQSDLGKVGSTARGSSASIWQGNTTPASPSAWSPSSKPAPSSSVCTTGLSRRPSCPIRPS